ncbi:MAG: TlpA family protein disulfide reductase [Nitrospirae bacterium]|nr:MAG: Redoxin protein [Leptospirillum sp. Group IV 'UBA BS']MCL4485220.1 TlpA family protein disulfide reductase [Nitrospirota bacterium]
MRKMGRVVALAFLWGLSFFHEALAADPQEGSGPSHPETWLQPVMPSLVLQDLSGRRVRTAALSGHPLLLLNFMAPWCEPCLKEIPSLLRLTRSADRDIAVVGVLEGPVNPETLKPFLRKSGVSFPLIRDPAMRFSRALGVRGLPSTFLVDSGGHIVSRVSGAVDWNDPRVRRYLKSFISSKAGF